MKITKRQLRRIIREETAKIDVDEDRMAELDMQLVDEIVDLLVKRGAVFASDRFAREFDDDLYQGSLDYVRGTIVPALSNLAARGAYDRK